MYAQFESSMAWRVSSQQATRDRPLQNSTPGQALAGGEEEGHE